MKSPKSILQEVIQNVLAPNNFKIKNTKVVIIRKHPHVLYTPDGKEIVQTVVQTTQGMSGYFKPIENSYNQILRDLVSLIENYDKEPTFLFLYDIFISSEQFHHVSHESFRILFFRTSASFDEDISLVELKNVDENNSSNTLNALEFFHNKQL